ncbi:hypothetical protein PB01_07540 [Psychrobacillus glaciei]|uniref:DUF3221 domain-containing protein n=1 Tax=Psychrobacillus glaciei TaxID=2283160 RepID=A0A5J6SL52_9BACI|nr:lipoprotein [Psychrobacillus glaciei]QFF98695.1 hypothetical protein PB01_07540 [Psychrobacillus glaciei]
MKKIFYLFILLLALSACSESVNVKDIYVVTKKAESNQNTLNIEVVTAEKYTESMLNSIIIDISSQYDLKKVNGIRYSFFDMENDVSYANAIIAFSETGQFATGAKKKNIAEIIIKE